MNIRRAGHRDLDVMVELNRDVQEIHVSLRPSVFKSTNDYDMTPGLVKEFNKRIDKPGSPTFWTEDK